MAKKFYKSESAVIAWDYYYESLNAMKKECDAFALVFGGNGALISFTITGHSFYGIDFKGCVPENSELWTKPRKQNEFTAHPRSSVKGKDLKLALKELNDKYKALRPNVTTLRFDPIYEALGTNWGDVMFSGMQWFKQGDFIYFSTGTSSSAEEIMGSEFEAALNKRKDELK